MDATTATVTASASGQALIQPVVFLRDYSAAVRVAAAAAEFLTVVVVGEFHNQLPFGHYAASSTTISHVTQH